VAASDDSGRTYLWNANNATRGHVLKPPDGSDVNCSVFSFGGGLLITGNRDGRAYLWDAASGALLRSVRDPGGIVDTVAIGGDGTLLATAGTGNAIHLWDATTGASLGAISDPGGDRVTSLAFDMMGTQLAVADKNGTTYVWSLAGLARLSIRNVSLARSYAWRVSACEVPGGSVSSNTTQAASSRGSPVLRLRQQ